MTNQTGTPKDTHYAKLRRAHRDAKRVATGQAAAPGHPSAGRDKKKTPRAESVRLYGLHTVAAALANPARRLNRLCVTRNALGRLGVAPSDIRCPVDYVEPKDLDRELGGEAVHQGVMLEAAPLPVRRLEDVTKCELLVVLDQVTDPHNVGAILRSAVAFGADAVIATHRHSPQESGVLAKAASGALEHVAMVEVVNLADAIERLKTNGFLTVGLDSEGPESFEAALTHNRIAVVLGAEGKGLRQKTREVVDRLARLEMPGAIRSLNVSNAAAIALYAMRSKLTQ